MDVFPDLDSAIDRWFAEDIGTGDHTTLGTIPGDANGSAAMLVKEEGIVAGIRVAERIFHRMDRDLKLEISMKDGQAIAPGDTVLRVTGKVHSILQCERLVLNVMQRMSGIATATREYVRLVEGTGARVIDTRKTTPGLRLLEKEAVRLGGGTNHRSGLHDMVLIKDNHIDFAGGIRQAIRAVTGYLDTHHLDLPVEVETRSLKDVEEVLSVGGVNRIMLDNFTVEQTREAVKLVAGRYETESSGGITRETIRGYAECGVDYISVGALTHHIKSLDLSLKAEF